MRWVVLWLLCLVSAANAADGLVVLRDEAITVPPGEWRYDEFVLKQQLPATVNAYYRVDQGSEVHAELVTRESLQAMSARRPHQTINVTATAREGELHQEIGIAGTYALVIVNHNQTQPATVAFKLNLDFSGKPVSDVRYLSPERKRNVILLSFFGFVTLVTLSARKLLLAMRQK